MPKASSQANGGGWEQVVGYLKTMGYRVICMERNAVQVSDLYGPECRLITGKQIIGYINQIMRDYNLTRPIDGKPVDEPMPAVMPQQIAK